MSRKTVAVFPGDDASPEVMHPTVELLEKLHPAHRLRVSDGR